MIPQLEKESKEFVKLLQVMRKLRDPQNGCPWDLNQTHQSIRSNLLEETHEALEALDNNDKTLMVEEFGDVLFQVIFHAQIAEDEESFGIYDVLQNIVSKLITRHPHVFGDTESMTTDKVLFQWEQIKAKERAQKQNNGQSILDGIPKSMPALAAAQSMNSRVRRTNLLENSKDSSIEQIIILFNEAEKNTNLIMREQEIGKALFLLADKADVLGIDAESALRSANEKFRFQIKEIESNAKRVG